MSISLSIYDVFSFTIPGFLYLYTFDILLRTLGYPNLRVASIDFAIYWLPIVLLAYLTGQLMDFFSNRFWAQFWYRASGVKRAYEGLLAIKPDDKIQFHPREWSLLLSVIRRQDPSTAEFIDRDMAISVMMRNVSFGLILFGLLNFYMAFPVTFSPVHLLGGIGLGVLSFISLRKADYYNTMFYSLIFLHAIQYGTNLDQILEAVRGKTPKRAKDK